MEYTQIGMFLAKNGLLPVIVFFAILGMVRVGWLSGFHLHQKSDGQKTSTDETLVSGILGLMALILAFAFSGAAGRLDQRERLVLAEANSASSAIGSFAYLNVEDAVRLQCQMKEYLSERLVLYTHFFDRQKFEAQQVEIEKLILILKSDTLKAVTNTSGPGRSLANESIKKINSFSDAYENQRQAMLLHPPRVIWITLIFLVLTGSFIAGYKMGLTKRKERLVSCVFAGLMSSAIFLTVSLEFPMLGYISLEPFANEFVRVEDSLSYLNCR